MGSKYGISLDLCGANKGHTNNPTIWKRMAKMSIRHFVDQLESRGRDNMPENLQCQLNFVQFACIRCYSFDM